VVAVAWGRVDDKYHGHRKVVDLSVDLAKVPLMVAAVGLNTLAWSWSNDQLTDGEIPKNLPTKLVGVPVDNLVAELLRVGLWEPHPKGYLIHDFLDYNPSREEVLSKKAMRSEAGKRGGQRSAVVRRETHGTAQPERLSDIFAAMGSEANAEASASSSASVDSDALSKQTPKQNRSKTQANGEAKSNDSRTPLPVPSSKEDIGGELPVDNSGADFRDIDLSDGES
jgi:hypothetical protein